MKFIFADSLDYVDPRYDFIEDRSPPDREPYWDDQYPHEYLGYAPYDGILVSRAIIGGHELTGKYSVSQAMRFRRVGVREFLRYRERDFPRSVVFGDSGAFAYHKMEIPPYTADDMVDFYGDGIFTHGCSVDHIIFEFQELEASQEKAFALAHPELVARRDITLENASEFLRAAKRLGNRFTPLGVVQGWSPLSMASSATSLVKMGYKYIAVGGMVPLKSAQIQRVLSAIRCEIGDSVKLHILGFAKADDIKSFAAYRITSFDTTSPLLRAFKDAKSNYYLPNGDGSLQYYSAIRIPQALENSILKSLVKEGRYTSESLVRREQAALFAMRAWDRHEISSQDTLDAVMNYTAPLAIGKDFPASPAEIRKMKLLKERSERTITDRPWKKCSCPVCQRVSIEVIIFRASNRNKRRGIHNLAVYGKHIEELRSPTIQ